MNGIGAMPQARAGKRKPRPGSPYIALNAKQIVATPAAIEDRNRSECQTIAVLNGEGVTALPSILVELRDYQATRKHCIKSKSRCDCSIDQLIIRYINLDAGSTELTEKGRKALFARATAVRNAVEKGVMHDPKGESCLNDDLARIAPVIGSIGLSGAMREPWDKMLKTHEKMMVDLAAKLPAEVVAFQRSVRGFGELGLAIVVAEVGLGRHNGGMADFATPQRIWKRLGLAVIDGRRQGKRTNKEEAAIHGYAPERRAAMWSLADSMLRAQWNGPKEKDEDGNDPKKSGKPVVSVIPAHPAGPYGAAYAMRRLHTEPRVEATSHLDNKHPDKWTPLRCKNDAVRYMFKGLLMDLHRVWHRAVSTDTVERKVA